MSLADDCSASNRAKIPFKDLQSVLNDQLRVVSDLLWYSISIRLARSSWVMISYSKDTSVLLYLASGFFGGVVDDLMTQL